MIANWVSVESAKGKLINSFLLDAALGIDASSDAGKKTKLNEDSFVKGLAKKFLQ